MIVSLIKYFNVKNKTEKGGGKGLFTSTAVAFGCKFKNVQSMCALNNKIFWKRVAEV